MKNLLSEFWPVALILCIPFVFLKPAKQTAQPCEITTTHIAGYGPPAFTPEENALVSMNDLGVRFIFISGQWFELKPVSK